MSVFDSLFKVDYARRRHLRAPFRQERERYLSDLLRRGRKPVNVLQAADGILHVNRALGFVRKMRPVTPDQLAEAGKVWLKYKGPFRIRPVGPHSYDLFGRIARSWLRHQSCLVERKKLNLTRGRLGLFASTLRDKVGLAPETVDTRTRHAGYFLSWLDEHGIRLSRVSMSHIERYFEDKRQTGWALSTRSLAAMSLRMFLRHAEDDGVVRRGLYEAIPKFPAPKYQFEAKGPSWVDVQKLLTSSDRGDPYEIRAQAMVFLMATYGLRCSEVRRLRIDDVDFDNGILMVRRGKTRRIQRFPINRDGLRRIAKYMNDARPKTDCPSLFVSHIPFYGRLSRGSVYAVAHRLLKENRIASIRQGPHAFRHACADRLMRQGVPVHEIAAFLGHRQTRSLRPYVRYSIDDLRPIAQFSLVGLR